MHFDKLFSFSNRERSRARTNKPAEEKEITYSIDETMTDITEKKCPILHALEIIG